MRCLGLGVGDKMVYLYWVLHLTWWAEKEGIEIISYILEDSLFIIVLLESGIMMMYSPSYDKPDFVDISNSF